MRHFFLASLLSLSATASFGVELVNDATIAEQIKQTEVFTLSNGIPVTYRRIEGSQIIHTQVSFGYGLVDLQGLEKAIPSVMFPLLTQGAKNWPKEKIYRTLEQNASAIGCDDGIEFSHCAMTTLNDAWNEVLPILTASILEPSFTPTDLKLVVGQKKAEIKTENQNPEHYVNEVVNRSFYPSTHPFWISSDDIYNAVDKFTVADMQKAYAEALNANFIRIVVVGSMDSAKLKADLEKSFGAIKKLDRKRVAITAPAFDINKSISVEDRKIPTAYIRAKINTPGFGDADEVATQLLFKILDEELGDLIRTKLSLSYSVYSAVLDYSTGIGVLHASTSKPKEVLESMQVVINKMRNETFTQKQLERFKVVYATQFFLTLEEHAALAEALARQDNYGHDVKKFYNLPKDLAAVTPEKIKELAVRFFKDFRLGVVYDKSQLKQEWLDMFVGKKAAH